MSAVVQETCSCLMEVMLLEVICSEIKQGTMKWQLTGPSAGAVVGYIAEKKQNGHLLVSNLTVFPCQSTCNSVSQAHQEEQISDTLKLPLAVVSLSVVLTIAVVTLVPALMCCYCKKRLKRTFPPNETPLHPPVPNPMYHRVAHSDEERAHAEPEELAASPNAAIVNEEAGHAEPEELAASPHAAIVNEEAGHAEPEELPASPHATDLPAEACVPVVIVDTQGYSKLQHFNSKWDPLTLVHVRYIEAGPGDETSILEQSYNSRSHRQGPLDAVHVVNTAAAVSGQPGTNADNTEDDAHLGNEMSEQLVEAALFHGGATNYTVTCRPHYLPTRPRMSESDGSTSRISNSPSTELHLSVPPRVRRSDIFDSDEEEDEIFGCPEVNRNEPMRQVKPPMPLPRRRRYSQENVLENAGAYSEAPPLYENVVHANS